MKSEMRKIFSFLLCFLMLVSVFPGISEYDHIHYDAGHEHEAHEDVPHSESDEHISVLDLCDGTLGAILSVFAVPVSADYEDGVECEHCGGWRYDDWKCDNGDHCGEGSGSDCYEEHHCGYCGACDDDHELCDDCGNCLEDHCECDEKCRGCYEQSGTVCSECGEKCSECAEWICDDCEKCPDCAGNEAYCSICDICINCAEWICYCGEGCSNCAEGCPDCHEYCTSCAEDELCKDCGYCFSCIGGDGNFCPECLLCKMCTEYLCECGSGCSECVLICESCGEKCENCADGGICKDCGTCYDCVGGDGNYCVSCDLCKFCVDYICVGCGEGCSECAIICSECGEKCENCADDQLCGDCEVCFDCRGGDGNYCADCGVCKMCVEYVCSCGNGCSECAYICAECGEKCSNCAEDQICIECGICFDCVGGEGNYCSACGYCKNCVDYVCYCGNGCSECSVICVSCGEKCENCADDELCSECERCFDCVGGEYCAECGECSECVEVLCACGNGCNQCADVICDQCGEKCSNCALDELCTECGTCRECVGGEDDFCDNCQVCKSCVDYICVGCGTGCSNCVDVICEECGEKCSNCATDELCIDCGICRECSGGEGHFCDNCQLCENCTEIVCYCGGGCSSCAAVCTDCGEHCSECSDGELCVECGKCVECAGSDSFCVSCGLCSDCGNVCPCGEGCENCADLCPDCGEVCSVCCDEFCASCDKCRTCADDLFCESCYQCGDCTQVCEECGLICESCAESRCEDCGKCSDCLDQFCPDCGKCRDCADVMCEECGYCGDCGSDMCGDCGAVCADCSAVCGECGVCENCTDTCPDCELCEDCCAEAAEYLGCTHGICPESYEWAEHYCEDGGHCITEDGGMEYDEERHWTVCGLGCSVTLNEEEHTYGSAEITKEATKKADGVLTMVCTKCDYTKEEAIPKLESKHEHKYEVTVTEATCTSGGYTTHTCECGHTWKDNVTPVGGHDYRYSFDDNEHSRECTVCHKVTDRGSHKLGEWKTVTKPGYTFNGEKQRVCRDCGYVITGEIPALTVPENKVVITIPDFSGSEVKQTVKPDGSKDVVSGVKPSETKPAAPSDKGGGTVGTDKPVQSPEQSLGQSEEAPSKTVIKELLTKGSENTVPALPTLSPTEDGNLFDGWVNKATGEAVKKGDVLTENIEIVPVFKDCGENNHNDKNGDNHCDQCGYIMVKEEKPAETDESGEDTAPASGEETAPVTGDGNENTQYAKGGVPTSVIIIIACVGGGVLIAVGVVLTVVLLKKKKTKNTDPTDPSDQQQT